MTRPKPTKYVTADRTELELPEQNEGGCCCGGGGGGGITPVDPATLPPTTESRETVLAEGETSTICLAIEDPTGEPVDYSTVDFKGTTMPDGSAPNVDPATGCFDYSAAEGDAAAGPYQLTYCYENANGVSNQSTLDIDVYVPPTAEDAEFTTPFDTPITIDKNALVADSDGTVESIVPKTDPASGILVDNGDGTCIYTPNAGFSGADSFDYCSVDNDGHESDPATITITTEPDNSVLAIDDGPVEIPQGGTATVDLVANDSDPEGDTFSVTAKDDSTLPAGLVPTDNGDGTCTYAVAITVAPGAYTHEYTITDSNGNTDTATVTIIVEEVTNLRLTTVDDSDLTKVEIGYAGSLRCDSSAADDDDCFVTEWYVEDAERTFTTALETNAGFTSLVETGRTLGPAGRHLVAKIEHCQNGTTVWNWAGSFITEPAVQSLIESEFSLASGGFSYNKIVVDDLMKGVTTYGGGGLATYTLTGGVARPASVATAAGGVADSVVAGTAGTDFLGAVGFARITDYGGEIFREGAEHVFLGTIIEGATTSCPGLESDPSNEVTVCKGVKRIKASPHALGSVSIEDPSTEIRARIQDTQFGGVGYSRMDHLDARTFIDTGVDWNRAQPEAGTIDFNDGNGVIPWSPNAFESVPTPAAGDYLVETTLTRNNGMFSTNQAIFTSPRLQQPDGRYIDARVAPRLLNIEILGARGRYKTVRMIVDDIPDAVGSPDFVANLTEAEIAGVATLDLDASTQDTVNFRLPAININQRFEVKARNGYPAIDNNPSLGVDYLETTDELWIVETF